MSKKGKKILSHFILDKVVSVLTEYVSPFNYCICIQFFLVVLRINQYYNSFRKIFSYFKDKLSLNRYQTFVLDDSNNRLHRDDVVDRMINLED